VISLAPSAARKRDGSVRLGKPKMAGFRQTTLFEPRGTDQSHQGICLLPGAHYLGCFVLVGTPTEH
jgi:hypothetical protein